MSQPTSKELHVISIAKSYYDLRKSPFSKFLQKISMFNKSYKVDSHETFETLWIKYGLHGNKKIKFSRNEEIECMDKWFKILYKADYDLITEYNTEYNNFIKQAREFYEKNPRAHVSYNIPTPEKYLKRIEEKFGPYDKY